MYALTQRNLVLAAIVITLNSVPLAANLVGFLLMHVVCEMTPNQPPLSVFLVGAEHNLGRRSDIWLKLLAEPGDISACH